MVLVKFIFLGGSENLMMECGGSDHSAVSTLNKAWHDSKPTVNG